MIRKIIVILFIISTLISVGYAEIRTLTDAELKAQKLKEIEEKIKENEAKIKPKQREKKKAEKTLGQLKKDLRYTTLKLRRAKQQLRKNKSEEIKIKQNLIDLEKLFQEKQNQFSVRLIDIYKTRNLGFIELIFSEHDTVSLANASYYFNKIIEHDINQIKDVKETHQTLIEKRKELHLKTKEISQLRGEISRKEYQLKIKEKKQQELISKLQNQINKIQEQNEDLERSSNEITRLIKKQGKQETQYYGTGTMIKPVYGWLSSKYGYRKHPIFKRKIFHRGIDIAAPKGYKIKAADSGVVIHVGQQEKYRGYGKVTIISHGRRTSDGKLIASFYAHQSRIFVKKGDHVKKGDTIGLVGQTGYATGPHLHFEVRIDGRPDNPMNYMKL